MTSFSVPGRVKTKPKSNFKRVSESVIFHQCVTARLNPIEVMEHGMYFEIINATSSAIFVVNRLIGLPFARDWISILTIGTILRHASDQSRYTSAMSSTTRNHFELQRQHFVTVDQSAEKLRQSKSPTSHAYAVRAWSHVRREFPMEIDVPRYVFFH